MEKKSYWSHETASRFIISKYKAFLGHTFSLLSTCSMNLALTNKTGFLFQPDRIGPMDITDDGEAFAVSTHGCKDSEFEKWVNPNYNSYLTLIRKSTNGLYAVL